MYNYDDFKDNIDLKYFADMILFAKKCFSDNYFVGRVTLGELMYCNGCESWKKIACIDKLVELGYIAVVKCHEISNLTTYRNIRL